MRTLINIQMYIMIKKEVNKFFVKEKKKLFHSLFVTFF